MKRGGFCLVHQLLSLRVFQVNADPLVVLGSPACLLRAKQRMNSQCRAALCSTQTHASACIKMHHRVISLLSFHPVSFPDAEC